MAKLAHRRAVVCQETALALDDLAPSRAREIHMTLLPEQRPRTPQSVVGLTLRTRVVPVHRDEVASRFGVQLPPRRALEVGAGGVSAVPVAGVEIDRDTCVLTNLVSRANPPLSAHRAGATITRRTINRSSAAWRRSMYAGAPTRRARSRSLASMAARTPTESRIHGSRSVSLKGPS